MQSRENSLNVNDSEEEELARFDKELYEKYADLLRYQRHVHKHNCLVDKNAAAREAMQRPAANEGAEVEKDDMDQLDDDDDDDDCDCDEGDAFRALQKKHAGIQKICRYGYPKPILERTMILEPLLKKRFPAAWDAIRDPVERTAMQKQKKEYDEAQRDYDLIREQLESVAQAQLRWIRRKDRSSVPDYPDFTYEEFLAKLQMTEEQYIKAIRSSIKMTTVFLKRTVHEIMINQYNSDIILRHRGNMDIQFIMDSHGLVVYLTSYMLKSHAAMSKLLNECLNEMKRNPCNLNLRSQMLRLANKFQNCSEISAQECVYHLLSTPVSISSRQTKFIMTFKRSERYAMIMKRHILERMPKGSRNIYVPGTIEHYAERPNVLEQMCLAEFAALYDYMSNERFERRKNEYYVPIPNKKDRQELGEEDYDDDQDDDAFESVLEEREIDREIEPLQVGFCSCF